MKNKSLPSLINILGTFMTVLSYIVLAIMVFQIFFTMIPNTFGKLPEGTVEMAGAIIGSTFAVVAVVFVPYKFARLHSNLQKYVDGKVPQKRFNINYVICWILSVLIVFGSLFSRNMAVIFIFVVVFTIPFVYLILTHKYTKITND